MITLTEALAPYAAKTDRIIAANRGETAMPDRTVVTTTETHPDATPGSVVTFAPAPDAEGAYLTLPSGNSIDTDTVEAMRGSGDDWTDWLPSGMYPDPRDRAVLAALTQKV